MRFRVMTYNIHKGIGGVDRQYRLERVAATIQHYQPDFALLQEVDDGVPRSRFERQVDVLAGKLSLPHAAFQSNVRVRAGGTYGNAILSRHPLNSWCDVDLSIPLKKRRRALVVQATLAGQSGEETVILSSLHLGLAGFERKLQLRRLLVSQPLMGLAREVPTILGGDFNDVYASLCRKIMLPGGFNMARHRVRTFPAVLPLSALDRIFYRGNVRLITSYSGRIQMARRASDHLPLIADFELGSDYEAPA